MFAGKSFHMLKIVITGPESSGKTKLAEQLAEHFSTEWVPEYARAYIDELDRSYGKEDLLPIAKGQVAAEEEAATLPAPLIFLDTSLEVIKIWSEFRYGESDPWISEKLMERLHNFYLLCRPDLPWEYDPQRKNPDDRQELFELYIKLLPEMQVPFAEVYGQGAERLKVATEAVLKQFPMCRYLLPEWRATPVIFFDGVCNFCNASVQWILRRDKKGVFRFAPLQSETARFLLYGRPVKLDSPDSVVLLHNKRLFVKTSAAIEMLRNLGGLWKLVGMAMSLIPPFISNAVYDFLARNRYRWFGKKEECMVPTKAERGRFISDGVGLIGSGF